MQERPPTNLPLAGKMPGGGLPMVWQSHKWILRNTPVLWYTRGTGDNSRTLQMLPSLTPNTCHAVAVKRPNQEIETYIPKNQISNHPDVQSITYIATVLQTTPHPSHSADQSQTPLQGECAVPETTQAPQQKPSPAQPASSQTQAHQKEPSPVRPTPPCSPLSVSSSSCNYSSDKDSVSPSSSPRHLQMTLSPDLEATATQTARPQTSSNFWTTQPKPKEKKKDPGGFNLSLHGLKEEPSLRT